MPKLMTTEFRLMMKRVILSSLRLAKRCILMGVVSLELTALFCLTALILIPTAILVSCALFWNLLSVVFGVQVSYSKQWSFNSQPTNWRQRWLRMLYDSTTAWSSPPPTPESTGSPSPECPDKL